MPTVSMTDTYYHIGGTIRKVDGEWTVVDNGTHNHRGLEAPTESGMLLRVGLRPGLADCGWGAVTMDGNLNNAGVTCGVTAQGDHLGISFMKDGVQIPPSHPVFDDEGANIWITWVQIRAAHRARSQ